MALKLKPPRKSKSPNYTIRGTYLGVSVDRTTGTPVEATAKQVLAAIKRDIERGRLAEPVAEEQKEPLFEEAALLYIKAGGDPQYLGKFDAKAKVWIGGVIPHLIGKRLSEVTQQIIDETAVALYPHASAATRNRQAYTPISSVLKHSGHDFKVRRPKGWHGKQRVDWLKPEQAFRLITAAFEFQEEFGAFLVFLLYTGARLNEGLSLTCDRLSLSEAFAYLPQTKNGDPRGIHLPPYAVATLANHPRGLDRGKQKVFRYRKCGRLYTWFAKIKVAAGQDLDHVTFHMLRHTWATWMRRYGGLDTRGLVATGTWKDQTSAARYEHVVVSEEARKADLLPTPKRPRKAKSVENPWNGKTNRANG